MEVLQVVCKADDRPKTDWLDKAPRLKTDICLAGASWEHI